MRPLPGRQSGADTSMKKSFLLLWVLLACTLCACAGGTAGPPAESGAVSMPPQSGDDSSVPAVSGEVPVSNEPVYAETTVGDVFYRYVYRFQDGAVCDVTATQRYPRLSAARSAEAALRERADVRDVLREGTTVYYGFPDASCPYYGVARGALVELLRSGAYTVYFNDELPLIHVPERLK